MGTLETFVVVKDAIFPVPDKGMRPVPELVFVHLYCVLAMIDPEKLTEVVGNNAHNT
jgi:hypothetical protein